MPTPKIVTLPHSALALASALLVLIGAFTVVGTIAGIVVGILGLLSIRKNPDKVQGVALAAFGIGAGIAFTVITLLILHTPDALGLGRYFRSSMWNGKVDRSTALEVRGDDFTLTLPSADWGIVKNAKLGQTIVDTLQGKDTRMLLMQTVRFAFVDIDSKEPGVDHPLEQRMESYVQDFPFKINEADTTEKIKSQENLLSIEKTLNLRCSGQPWVLILRLSRKPEKSKLIMLRAFAPKATFRDAEREMRKILDSLKIEDDRP